MSRPYQGFLAVAGETLTCNRHLIGIYVLATTSRNSHLRVWGAVGVHLNLYHVGGSGDAADTQSSREPVTRRL